MGHPGENRNDYFTYRQYRVWPEDDRWELIDGKAYSMAAAPHRDHQEITGRLYNAFMNFLKGKSCKVLIAPFDALFPKAYETDDEVDTVVQPDIAVFCDKSKLCKHGARGAPDIAVEVLSSWTSTKDSSKKFDLYEPSGVREYWVINPGFQSVMVYRRGPDGRFDEGDLREPPRDPEPVESEVLPGFSILPAELFEDLD